MPLCVKCISANNWFILLRVHAGGRTDGYCHNQVYSKVQTSEVSHLHRI